MPQEQIEKREPLPPAVVAQVVAEQQRMNWPECVPSLAEFPGGLWQSFESLNVGDCEQLVEFNTRLARKALQTFRKNGKERSAKKAGRHIFLARHFGIHYLVLTNQVDGDESKVPFANMTDEI